MPNLWRVYCDESTHPGQWAQWFRHQCAAFGWPPGDGYRLEGETKQSSGWSAVRNVLKDIRIGDHVVIALPGSRVARLGEVIRLAVDDRSWQPMVRQSRAYPHGENGRLIHLRWDLVAAPDDRDTVVLLPEHCRFQSGYEITGTIKPIRSMSLDALREVMRDPANWVVLGGSFAQERALSDYIGAHPHRLEEGMIRHPSRNVRENCFPDRTRSDVILQDRDERVVVVECKQNGPTRAAVAQLRHYMDWICREFPEFGEPRGILVHGASRVVHPDVLAAAQCEPRIQLIHHRLDVEFSAISTF